MTQNVKDLTNKKFGLLAPKKILSVNPTRWLCLCDCGNEVVRHINYLRNNDKASCGCIRKNYRYEDDRELAAYKNRYRKNVLYPNKKFNVSQNQISLDEYIALVKSNCFYCGDPPANTYSTQTTFGGPFILKYGGIDRIYPEYGYIKNNVRPSCMSCNVAKNTGSTSNYLKNVLATDEAWGITGELKYSIPIVDDPVLPHFQKKQLRSNKEARLIDGLR